jgi:hypothetical protein
VSDARKQTTRPKKGKPIEIPVPKRDAFDALLRKAQEPPRRPAKG